MPAAKDYWKDPEKARQKKREYYAANRDIVRAKQKVYAEKNKEKTKERTKLWIANHKQEMEEKQHKWYWENRERLLARVKEWRTNNPDYNLKRRIRLHGITVDRYRELLELQNGGCAICGGAEKALFIDHDHTCCSGKNGCEECVRGLLCARCNYAIGLLKENERIILSAAAYVKKNGFRKFKKAV